MFALYAEVRASGDHESAWHRWQQVRDALFREHRASPLPTETRAGFPGLDYFPYDPALRVLAVAEPADPELLAVAASGGGTILFTRFGTVQFALDDVGLELALYWLEGYGGGAFLPFADATCGSETYGAGRYLLDTVKGADLGEESGRLVLDFNFAYNPSCAYDPSWVCPLTPPANRLPVPIRAGERHDQRH